MRTEQLWVFLGRLQVHGPDNPAVHWRPAASEEPEERGKEKKAERGDCLQARFIPTWKQFYPDVPLDYKSWGFAKLGEYFESISDVRLDLLTLVGSRSC